MMDLRRELGAVVLERDVVQVGGDDATTFLQGQLSADLTSLDEGTATWALLLEPTGKMGVLVRVTRILDSEWMLDIEAGLGDTVRQRLQRFLLRVKVDVTQRRQPMVAVRGPGAATVDGDVGTWKLDAGWHGVEAVDVLGGDGVVPDGAVAATFDDFEAVRIWCGAPAHGAEITDETIPGELGADVIDATVSFTKGCYTGQELVARIDSRGGNVPRPVRRLRPAAPVPVGAAILAGDDEVGRVTSAADHPAFGPVALGVVQRRVEPGSNDVVALDAKGERVPIEIVEPPGSGTVRR